MSEVNADVIETTKDNTDAAETTDVTTEVDPIINAEKKSDDIIETKPDDQKADDEPAEFVEYNFDEVVKLKEGVTLSDESKAEINRLGKEFGIKPEKVQLLVDSFLNTNAANAAAAEEAHKVNWDKKKAANSESLKKEWGIDTDKNKAIITKAFEAIPKETGFMEYVVKNDLATEPPIAKMLLWAGLRLSEDTLEGGEPPQGKEVFKKYSDILPQDNVHNTTKTTL